MGNLISDESFLEKQKQDTGTGDKKNLVCIHTKHRDACGKRTTRITASIPIEYAKICKKHNLRYSYVLRKGMESILFNRT